MHRAMLITILPLKGPPRGCERSRDRTSLPQLDQTSTSADEPSMAHTEPNSFLCRQVEGLDSDVEVLWQQLLRIDATEPHGGLPEELGCPRQQSAHTLQLFCAKISMCFRSLLSSSFCIHTVSEPCMVHQVYSSSFELHSLCSWLCENSADVVDLGIIVMCLFMYFVLLLMRMLVLHFVVYLLVIGDKQRGLG
jgi:hypothetical protein